MPYFKNNDLNVLFIHIPKTGGTSVEINFSEKFNIKLNNDSLYSHNLNETKLNENIIINSSLQHMTYNKIVEHNEFFKIDFNNIKIITIVRNPYERIISDLFFYKLIDVDTSKEKVFDIINEYLLSDSYDMHNAPQYIFILDKNNKVIPDVNILKTENLTIDMNNLGYTDFDRFDNKNQDKPNYYSYLNNKSIKRINNFYHFDFLLFNYHKINIIKPINWRKMEWT